jgi:hypothetical protein
MSTFAELKSNISKELGLDETASGNDDVLLGRRINQAIRQVLIDLQLYVITASISLTASTNEYQLPAALTADPLAILKLVNSDNVPLERVSVEEIHDLRRGAVATGSNVYRYAVNGANLLMLYPTPSAAGTLTAYYVPTPTVLTGTDDPSGATFGGIPVQYHDLIEYWAMWRMARRMKHEPSSFGLTYKQEYDQAVFGARKSIRKLGGRKLGPVRRGRRLSVPSDPSQT